MKLPLFLLLSLTLTCPSTMNSVWGEEAVIGTAEKRKTGELVHRVRSPRQAGETLIRVLTPTELPDAKRCRVVYVLPVEAGEERRYGDGLEEVARLGLQNSTRMIFVAPTFSHLPWYADHPTDQTIQQESYFTKDVVPFVDANYPTTEKAEDRFLLGFSKSGCGAFQLLLRHPAVFGKAVAWDAPLMMDAPGKYGSGPIYGTAENFARYQLTELVRQRADDLKGAPRLMHIGFGNFRSEHEAFERHLMQLNVPHIYVDGPQRKHIWESGWVEPAVRLLTLHTNPVARPVRE